MCSKESDNHHTCACHGTSMRQTLDEMDFERGIWGAALNNDVSQVKRCLDRGIDVNIRDNYGYTALHYAARQGSEDICALLLQRGSDANAQTHEGHSTPLHRAAYCGKASVVKMLLSSNANVKLQDNDGETALHKAARSGCKDTVCLILTADPNVKSITDCRGNTAAEYAKDTELQKLLQ